MRTLKQQLKSGKILLGVSIMYHSPGVIERIGPDWDWIWVDSQHGQHDYRSVLECVRAADSVQRDSVVRVPGHEYGLIGLALDTAASGVMVPVINSADEARMAAAAAKFPPVGKRSYGGRRPIDLYGRAYSATANEDTLLVVQIETPEAVKHAGEIAAVPGVDLLFFGGDDLSMYSGLPMDKPRKNGMFRKEMEQVAKAAAKHGKLTGGAFAGQEDAKEAAEMGYRLMASVADVALLARASKESSSAMRAALGM